MTTPAPHSKAGQVRALIEAATAAGLSVVEIGAEGPRVWIRTAPLAERPGEGDTDPAEAWLRRHGGTG